MKICEQKFFSSFFSIYKKFKSCHDFIYFLFLFMQINFLFERLIHLKIKILNFLMNNLFLFF